MLEIDDKVEQDHGAEEFEPHRPAQGVEQAEPGGIGRSGPLRPRPPATVRRSAPAPGGAMAMLIAQRRPRPVRRRRLGAASSASATAANTPTKAASLSAGSESRSVLSMKTSHLLAARREERAGLRGRFGESDAARLYAIGKGAEKAARHRPVEDDENPGVVGAADEAAESLGASAGARSCRPSRGRRNAPAAPDAGCRGAARAPGRTRCRRSASPGTSTPSRSASAPSRQV